MKICITGKPCSGKSLAMEYIKNAGYNTWIADEWVHQAYLAGGEGYQIIKKEFGNHYINNEEVDRKALGSLVFNDKNALNKLNSLINPLIKKAIDDLDDSCVWFVELGTYLFYPDFFNDSFDKIVLIFNNQKWKKSEQKQKFSYLKKIPTFFVENSKTDNPTILNIDIKNEKQSKINVDIFVNNSKTKKFLQNNILKVCKSLI